MHTAPGAVLAGAAAAVVADGAVAATVAGAAVGAAGAAGVVWAAAQEVTSASAHADAHPRNILLDRMHASLTSCEMSPSMSGLASVAACRPRADEEATVLQLTPSCRFSSRQK
jgi:hypothetical protein